MVDSQLEVAYTDKKQIVPVEAARKIPFFRETDEAIEKAPDLFKKLSGEDTCCGWNSGESRRAAAVEVKLSGKEYRGYRRYDTYVP